MDAELLDYLGVVNFVVALGYYAIILLILGGPVAIPWLRRLGKWGALFALMMVEFFFGCGTHHLEMSGHFLVKESIMSHGWHFLLWDSIQVQGAIGALIVGVWKGRFFVDKLRKIDGERSQHG